MRLPALAAVLAASTALGWFQVYDHDIFFHIMTGQVILETGRFLRTNLFSSTFPDYPWINPEWLFQVLVAMVSNTFGWIGIAVAKAAVVGLTATVLYSTLLVVRRAPWPAAAMVIFCLVLMRFRLTERPHLLSYLLFATLLYVLTRTSNGGRQIPWVLPPLFVLWANVHPEFVFGLLLLAGTLLGQAFDRRRLSGAMATARTPLLPAALLCFIATLLNPEGWRVLAFPFMHLGLGPVIDVTEYRSSFGYPVPFFWAALALTAAILLKSRRTLTAADVLPLGGMAVLAVAYIRAIPYFALVMAPVLHRQLFRLFPDPDGRQGLRVRTAVLIGGAAAFLATMVFERPAFLRWGYGVHESLFPIAAANFLSAKTVPGRLYNDFSEGGYLIWRLWPRIEVFQDGRLQAYPRSFFARQNRLTPDPDWEGLLREYQVNTALVRRRDLGKMHLGGREWGIVFWDDVWVVLLRRVPAATAVLEQCEYHTYLPGMDFSRYTDPAKLRDTAEEIRSNQATRLRPSPDVANHLGIVLARLQRNPEALAAFQEAVRIAPDFAPAWENIGLMYRKPGDRSQAVAALSRALRLDPSLETARKALTALGVPPPAEAR